MLILNSSHIFTVIRGINLKKNTITVPEYKFFINVLQKTPVGKKKKLHRNSKHRVNKKFTTRTIEILSIKHVTINKHRKLINNLPRLYLFK
jgi:hypothetical protein